ncbi:MAG: hypothetical protein ABI867_29890 [Kofleriaceae bacterium]
MRNGQHARPGLAMMIEMPHASFARELRLFVLVPRDEELAEFVQDALAFKPVTLRVGRSLGDAVVALREHRFDVLLVDIDALSPDEAGQLQAGLTHVHWRGRVVTIGTATAGHRDRLVIHHELAARLTSIELRNAIAALA